MKLILANNQSEKFLAFYKDLQATSKEDITYDAYESLLFRFSGEAHDAIDVISVVTKHSLCNYDGVYINGYMSTYELAAAVAICCDDLKVPYVNRELANAPSLSKLTAYAKLAAAGIRIPFTIAGTQAALLRLGEDEAKGLTFPAVLKRADADRGIDNFKVSSLADVYELLRTYEKRTLWILQDFIENDGFFLVTYYYFEPKYGIFRTLEARTDGDKRKAHMYKPKGGINATLIAPTDLPESVVSTTKRAVYAMNRQIGSVDCIYDQQQDRTYILEVNYNPQMVTIETFKDIRLDAFLDGMQDMEHKYLDK